MKMLRRSSESVQSSENLHQVDQGFLWKHYSACDIEYWYAD